MSPMTDLHEDRDVRTKALLLGHIRLGIFKGRAPSQTDSFVFTSTDRQRLEPLAEDFGGKVEGYTPQGAGTDRWRLISETDAFTALFPFADERNLSQDWMLWKRSGLQRKCDGYTCSVYTTDEESGEIDVEDTACICAAKDERECSPETRIRLLIPQTGLGIWELTTGSKIAALDLYAQYQFIAAASRDRVNHVPVRVVYAPREISYFDEKKRKRKTTTKRLVSLSVAGDAIAVLQGLQMEPNHALLAAVEKTLKDAGRELPSVETRKALEAGEDENPSAEAPTPEPPAAGPATSNEAAVASSEDPDLDLPATPEQWAIAAKHHLTKVDVMKAAKERWPEVKGSPDITKRQLNELIQERLDK
jgi:hypothetical protein